MNKIIIFISFFFFFGYSQDWELVWSDEFNGNGAIDTVSFETQKSGARSGGPGR